MWTVSVGDADMAEVLLRAGADANVRRPDGSTVLHIAAHSDAEPAIARMLLAAGADPTVRDREGKTPADYARDDHLTELAAILEPSAAGAVVSANAPVIH
jgi:ankyrin repeat protein